MTGKCFPLTNFPEDKQTQESLESGFPESEFRETNGVLGCIGPLIKMLDGKAVEEKEAASKALSLLLLYAGNRRIFRKAKGGIVSIVQLLDASI